MKFMFLAFALFLNVTLQAQQKPFKGATTIVVTVDTTDILKKLDVALFERGFTVDQKTDSYIITKGKEIGRWSAKMIIRALVKENKLLLTGQTAFSLTLRENIAPDYEPLKYGGMKGSIIRDAWEEMEAIADTIGTITTYTK